MKIEFNKNGNGFFAEMDSDLKKNGDGFDGIKSVIAYSKSLFFAVIAFMLSFLNLPFGLIINLSSEAAARILDSSAPHLFAVLISIASLICVISVLIASFALSLYFSSKKHMQDKAGVIVSILSFAVNALCITLIIIGFILW